jgi:electron transfer flavoprotein beta subunit
MKICVCVKQVEQTYARTGKDPDRYFLNPEDRIFRINPYDEEAMELALKAKAQVKGTRIIVLTLGPWQAEDELWRIMGMGGDQLCRVEIDGTEDWKQPIDSWCKAQALSRVVKTLKADLVLCGKESIDLQNGLVGAYIAHQLNRPFISAILDFAMEKGGTNARITKNASKGRREIIDCPLPAVFSVDLSSRQSAATPSYIEKKHAMNSADTLLMYTNQLMAPRTMCVSTFAPRPRTKPIPSPDSSLASPERIRLLLSGSRIQKKGKTVFGSAESQAREIVAFLENCNIILSSTK